MKAGIRIGMQLSSVRDELVGEGDVRRAEVLPLCLDPGGAEWLTIEQGDPRLSQLEAAERCRANLAGMPAAPP